MKICVIGNVSDRKCGFQNFTMQTDRALRNAGHDVTLFDGTYSLVYARREAGIESFLPPDADAFDVIHVVWHPATLNHYSGAVWPTSPVKSVWNGCPAAWCPFNDAMDVKWGVLGREPGHRQIWYPIPDWVTDLPEPNQDFTVGYSGVRGDGLGELTEVCTKRGWATNFSQKEIWLTQEEEIRRLAKSTVNVCWYSGVHDDRSGSAMVCLASRRPLLVSDVPMMTHLEPYPDVIRADYLEPALDALSVYWWKGFPLNRPRKVLDDLSWTKAVAVLEEGWRTCRR